MDDRGQQQLAGLLAKAQSMADAARHAYRPVPEVAEASDETGAVTVTIEDHGRRVARVAVAADWKTRIPAARLGMAVVEAVMSVQTGPLKDFFAALSDAKPAEPQRLPSAQPAAIAASIAKLTWDDLGSMLETVHKALDALAVTAARPQAVDAAGGSGAGIGAEKTVGRSGNRRVEVTLAGGQLTSVTVDEKWAEQAGRQQLSDALRQAFEDAYAQAGAPDRTESAAGLAAELQSVAEKIGVELPPE